MFSDNATLVHLQKTFLNIFSYIRFGFLAVVALTGCTTIDLHEKTISIPGHAWETGFKPSFQFSISDTSSLYQPFLIIRHNEKYNYNNIWLTISVLPPGAAIPVTFRTDIRLANNEDGWLGDGMDDIYEHRILLLKEMIENNISFRKPGVYTFTIEQIMRENPLENVMDIGLRIEKK